jgi:hypothetical protein
MVVATTRSASDVTSEASQAFVASMCGPVIQPDDPAYDEVRSLYNGMIDKRPRMIARCVDAADVISAVKFGRDQRLLVAIRVADTMAPALAAVMTD